MKRVVPIGRRLPAILLILLPAWGAAQARMELTLGAGTAWVSERHSLTDYNGRIGFNGFFNLYVPVNRFLFLKTGLGYQQKRYQALLQFTDRDKYISRLDFDNNYQFISVPFQVGMDVPVDPEHKFTIAGGMCYNFMFAAQANYTSDQYLHNQFQSRTYTETQPRIGLGPTVNTDPKDRGSLLLFTPALRFDLGYVIEYRWSFNAFYEYHLQDVNVETSSARMHYTGVSVGFYLCHRPTSSSGKGKDGAD